MTIALDATYSIGDELSGVGVYSRELLMGLAAGHPEVSFRFCYRPHRFLRSWSEELPSNARGRLFTDTWLPGGAEIFHGLNQRLPRARLRRAVATFHDLFVLTGEYSTPDFRARFAAQAREAATRADVIIAVSEFTKQQVVALLGVEPSRVRVVHHGIRGLALQPVAREKIILSVGAIQKRKNLARLVTAFEKIDPRWKLVLAGSAGFGAAEIMERIGQSPARDRIEATGYVTAEELARWYSRASIFAFPSLDEGFGMPVLEAMSAGIPVITANRSALREVAGDAALLVNPEDTDELADAVQRLTLSEKMRRDLTERGRERARLFSWDQAVRETWDVYQSLLG